MSKRDELLKKIQTSSQEFTLTELLRNHPEVSRRSLQRWINQWVTQGLVQTYGQGRARRYQTKSDKKSASRDVFPSFIPISPDSEDILAYIEQPLASRKSVPYQAEFLYSYLPNQTYYLSSSLRSQLKKMGKTGQTKQIAGTYGRSILSRLLIDLAWASSQLEGNTYSRLDTFELIEHGKVTEGKAFIETQMILNHKAAIELLINNASEINFNRYTLLNLHSALSENLLPNPADEGRIRQHTVEIGKSVFKPLMVPQKINEMFDLLLKKAQQIQDPFEQAFFVMVQIPYLQPFADVNKRTSRLAANLPLIRNNLCPLTFIGVPEKAYSRAILGVYELTRIELLRDLFVWAYEQSTHEYITIKQHLVEPDPLRLRYREFIKKVIHKVLTQPEQDTLALIHESVMLSIANLDQKNIEALIIDELRRLHEGVLARYGVKISEFKKWQKLHLP